MEPEFYRSKSEKEEADPTKKSERIQQRRRRRRKRTVNGRSEEEQKKKKRTAENTGTRVLETWVSEPWDASLLNSFANLTTN